MNFNNIMRKVFLWMTLGLLLTFGTACYVSTNENIIHSIISSSLYYVLIIIELILVIVLSARIGKMSPQTARILFLLYSFVTGLTFSTIFITFHISSIIIIFLMTAIVFGILGLIGYTTKVDLSKMGDLGGKISCSANGAVSWKKDYGSFYTSCNSTSCTIGFMDEYSHCLSCYLGSTKKGGRCS